MYIPFFVLSNIYDPKSKEGKISNWALQFLKNETKIFLFCRI